MTEAIRGREPGNRAPAVAGSRRLTPACQRILQGCQVLSHGGKLTGVYQYKRSLAFPARAKFPDREMSRPAQNYCLTFR
jgi:hypothetical protein